MADICWQKVYRINTAGTASELLVGRAFSGLALSSGGVFPAAIYASDYNANCVIASNINGTLSILASNIPAPVCLALDATGRFGNDMFVAAFVPDTAGSSVSTRPSGLIYRVKPDGATSVFASGLRFRHAASGDLAFGFNGDLFVLEDGRNRILRFSPSDLVQPELSVARVGNYCIVSWPITGGHWVLERVDSLTPPAQWATVETAPVVDGDHYRVTLAITHRSQFYRLKRMGL